jgi:hypothetical protein
METIKIKTILSTVINRTPSLCRAKSLKQNSQIDAQTFYELYSQISSTKIITYWSTDKEGWVDAEVPNHVYIMPRTKY